MQKLFLALALLGLVFTPMDSLFARAQDDSIMTKDEAALAPKSRDNMTIKDFAIEEHLNSTVPLLNIQSIEPEQGPMTGNTRVLIRGGPFQKWEFMYPHPVCKIGDVVVEATYVTCSGEKTTFDKKESRHKDRQYRCLQCDNTPVSKTAKTVSLQISVTGDFSDSTNEAFFTYYQPTRIWAFYPRYGPKDGETPVQVWGENFIDFGDETRCGFGTKTTRARVFNSSYIECESPMSDVVEKPIPFTISLNGQQNSKDTLFYYYYNWPSIEELVPNHGPEMGGTQIMLKGRNFFPFKEMLDEINNANDTFCAFLDLKVRVPAVVTNSTRAFCISPPSYYYHQSRVEIALNGIEYTDDEQIFYYYKPPLIFDIQPREGPVKGGTLVKILGTNFQDTPQLRCSFGGVEVPGKFISSSEVECISPPADKAGFVDVRLAFEEDLWSTPVKFLYYGIPKITNIEPTCGPETGYTQIAVYGSGFTDLGRNKAMCVFNRTVFTNATVMGDDLMYCDSPALLNVQGYSLLNGDDTNFYNLQVTIDGGHWIAGTPQKFNYYQQPVVKDVTPNRGPLSGNSEVKINVTGLHQPGKCHLKVRLGTQEYVPEVNHYGQLVIKTVPVDFPGYSVVQVSYNNQQFTDERIVHKKDVHSTFKYYQNPIVTYHSPISGPSCGGTTIKIDGFGFKPFEDGSDPKTGKPYNRMYVRYLDEATGDVITDPVKLEQNMYSNEQITIKSVPHEAGTKALIQISLNNEDWIDVKAPGAKHSFVYYQSPQITAISPTFGPLKSKKAKTMTISGENFICQEPPCKNVKVRFGNPPNNAIYMPGELKDDGTIQCQIPMYTKPDVLPVQVTLNGVDYSNDNITFGFYDPYVIDAQPRLIATDGSTRVTVKGLGFVNSGETKVQYENEASPFNCENGGCIRTAEFIDKNHIVADTPAQKDLKYVKDGQPVLWDSFNVEASVYNDDFTNNRVELFYYDEPTLDKNYSGETPANIQTEIFINMQINKRDLAIIRKYGMPKARFTYGEKSITVDAVMLHTPLVSAYDGSDFLEPNAIKIKTPMWELAPGATKEDTKLEVSLNGYNFIGSFEFIFTEPLILHRTVPMAGPLTVNTNTFLIGQGFRSNNPKFNYNVKWGTIMSDEMPRPDIKDYQWDLERFMNTIEGSDNLRAYIYEASRFARVDTAMFTETEYRSVYRYSDRLIDPQGSKITPVGSDVPYKTAYNGGPWYVEVGRDISIPTMNTLGDRGNQTLVSSHIFYDYDPSAVEFYQYPQPTMLYKYPNYGIDIGGTIVEIVGHNFLYKAEYGIVPHCKFGDKIVRAQYDSTVRLVCRAPPNDQLGVPLSFEVSQNGVDWTDTGFTFSYYKQPVITSVTPDAGPAQGGSEVYINGENFPQMQGGQDFNCRFSPMNTRSQPKTMPAEWINSTTIMCITPGGWAEGDQMKLQVTFNGKDYDSHGFNFIMYKIKQALPRSGPSDGTGGDIVISGQGFRQTVQPLCKLNGTVYEPISVTWTEIRCPMPAAQSGPNFFGNVDFAISANGVDWKEYEGGFQYYKNPIVEDIFPKSGPAQGIGIINFYGSGFRSDFPLAKIGCKIGDSIGDAIVISDTQLRCVVEDIPTVAEGEKLPARAALNSYSWSELNDDTFDSGETYFVPYSIASILPDSGPISGGTEIIVHGKGFTVGEAGNESPRCRFGTPSNFIIVEADVVSYTRLVCRVPEGMKMNTLAVWPVDVPFSIALSSDSFEPWTQTSHKFRFYKQPEVSKLIPEKVTLGSITEVMVVLQEDPEKPDNIFFEPSPIHMAQGDMNDDEQEEYMATMGTYSQLKCSFGVFGDSDAVFVNETTIKCLTPSFQEDPEDYSVEEVPFSVSLNGFTFDQDSTDAVFTFEGTGEPMSNLPIVLFIIALGILIAATIVYFNKKYSMPDPNDN